MYLTFMEVTVTFKIINHANSRVVIIDLMTSAHVLFHYLPYL